MANTSNMSSESVRRAAMGLSTSTYRRESGKVTENDIRKYLAETRAMASKRMSADELEDYMYEIEKKTRAENPITKLKKKPKRNRKKLPTKPKIDIGDSVVVLDKNENLNTVVPPEAKPQERQSFKGLAKAGALSLGSSVFNKMFPTLDKGLEVLKSELEKQKKNTADSNIANKSYAQQVERSSVFLTNITDGQTRTNDLLQQILVAVNAGSRPLAAAPTNPAPGPAPGPGGTQTPPAAQNRTPPATGAAPASGTTRPIAQMNTGTAAATLAAGAAVAGAGYAASNALGIGGSSAQVEPDESGTFRRSATGEANMQVDYSRAAGKQTINNREVDRETYSRFRQLSRGRDEEDPRYAQYLEENRKGPDSFFADSNARQRVSQERSQELRQLVERVERGEASPEAAAARQAAAQPGTQPAAQRQTATPAMSQNAATSTTPGTSTAVNPTANPGGFNARILNMRAEEILFKADRFEYSQGTQISAGGAPGGSTGGEGSPSAGGATTSGGGAAIAAGGGAATGGGATQTGAANITGLDFAAGVDQRIKPNIADKTKEIQSAFGKKLMVTSGFRDPARNSRVGGAGGSKHLTGDAVDVQFPGNQQETIDFIKVASEKGAGGIGVYRPGFLHIDTGAKRVWGPDYKATSIPDWAKPALDEHMGKTSSQAAGGGGGAAAGGESASPMPGAQQAATPVASAPSAPAATPEPASPSSGAAVSRASVSDETASRPAPIPPPAPPDASAPISVTTPGPSLPGIDPNNPGPVEPADAAIRYSRLFNIAA